MFDKGEVHLVDLNPTVGGEIKKIRPAVIVSNNVINASYPVVVVCPITDSTGKKSPIHILLSEKEGGLKKESVVHCGQIRTLDKNRLLEKLGNISAEKMCEIETGIKYVLF
ncbi:MAG: type II toxin-antitoxin system PemK/MazF family toxin [bacterium]